MDVANFLTRVVIPDPGGCWLWTGTLTEKGYGTFCSAAGNVRAHRWSYEQFVGPIPDGLVTDHLCRVRRCVNPTHIEPVTVGENTRRGAEARGYTPSEAASAGPWPPSLTHCKRGHEYTRVNTRTRVRPDGRVFWACKACERLRDMGRDHHKKRHLTDA